MASKKKAKAKPKGPVKRHQRDPNRDERGRLVRGHKSPGPGRPPIPAEFKDRGEEALRWMFGVATGDIDVDDDELRYRAAHDVVLLVYSKKARFEGDIPTSHEDRVKAMEAVVYQAAADGGDVEAARAMLEALEPTKWGKKSDDGAGDDTVDSLEFVPLISKQKPDVEAK